VDGQRKKSLRSAKEHSNGPIPAKWASAGVPLPHFSVAQADCITVLSYLLKHFAIVWNSIDSQRRRLLEIYSCFDLSCRGKQTVPKIGKVKAAKNELRRRILVALVFLGADGFWPADGSRRRAKTALATRRGWSSPANSEDASQQTSSVSQTSIDVTPGRTWLLTCRFDPVLIISHHVWHLMPRAVHVLPGFWFVVCKAEKG